MEEKGGEGVAESQASAEKPATRSSGGGEGAEQEDGDKPAYICIRDANGNVLTRLESRHIHGVGVDSRGDIYAGLTVDRSVDKFVRKG